MEKVTSICKVLFDAVYDHRINTMGDCHVALAHPDTFQALLDERMTDSGMSVISTPEFEGPYIITKLNIVGIEVRRCPDVEIGTFEIF